MGFFCQNIAVTKRKSHTSLSCLLFCLYTHVTNHPIYHSLIYVAVVHSMVGLSPN
ncbi:hypothetical protein FHS24_000180 [Psychrobacter luti]|uniref:Uncharacterized protein n=1 Tax=Psychrobacter luti TaxID=198481 RepID=A0A839T988_9GAMM|nr:hypothetical protein [Psychrobacter luti]